MQSYTVEGGRDGLWTRVAQRLNASIQVRAVCQKTLLKMPALYGTPAAAANLMIERGVSRRSGTERAGSPYRRWLSASVLGRF